MIYFKSIIKVTIFCLLAPISAYSNVCIIVDQGEFKTVEMAATGEKLVDWNDANVRDDNACTECFAAEELKRYLPYSFTVKLENISFATPTGDLPASDDIFIVGSRETNFLIEKFIPKSIDLISPESFHIYSLLSGDRIITVIEGKTRIGVLYGVYDYLERNGIRFYGLGDTGTVYPAVRAESFPVNLKITENPKYLTRGFWSEFVSHSEDPFVLWMARNKLNLWAVKQSNFNAAKKLGIHIMAGGHDIMRNCLNPDDEYPYNHLNFDGDDDKPADPYGLSSEYIGDTNKDRIITYFEAHPEWFSLIAGKRTSNIDIHNSGDNFCTSNVEAVTELARNAIKHLRSGVYSHADVLNVWPLDNGRWCQCEQCQAMESQTDKLFKICYQILKELERVRSAGELNRDVLITTCAYHETITPPHENLPKDFDYNHFAVTFFPIERCFVHPLPDPSCEEINDYLTKSFLAWTQGKRRSYLGEMFIGEYYNVSSIMSLPVVYTRIMATDIPWYYRHGARHFCYMHSPTDKWGTWTLNQRLMARFLWDIDAEPKKILDEYFRQYYPTTQKYAQSYYDCLENAFANIKPYKHYVGVRSAERKDRYSHRSQLTRLSEPLFSLDHLQYESHSQIMNNGPGIMEMLGDVQQAMRLVESALVYCHDPLEKQRIQEDYNRIEYGLLTWSFYYYMTRTSMFHRQGDAPLAEIEFHKAAEYADKLKKIEGLALGSRNGFEATQSLDQFEFFKKIYLKE